MIIRALVDLASASTKGITEAQRALESGLEQAGTAFKKNVEDAFAGATAQGRGASKEVVKQMNLVAKLADEIKDNTSEEARLRADLMRAERAGSEAEVAQIKRMLDLKTQAIRRDKKATNSIIARVESHTKKIEEIRRVGQERRDRDSLDKIKDSSELLESGIEGAFSGNIDASGLTKQLAGALSTGLGSAAAGASGGSAAALAGLSASVAALAGPIAALAGVFAMAYSQAKDMNKEIMASASAFDLMGNSGGNVEVLGSNMKMMTITLNQLRSANIDLATSLRMSTEDAAGIGKAFFETGITLREFKQIVPEITGSLSAYREVTKKAALASQGMGLEISSVAEFYNTMVRDLGGNIKDIDTAFGMISGGAQKAGMRTKDFFDAVLQASGGMALYNIRVQDTIGLFEEMVEILREDMAKAKIGFEGTFRNMGMQERYKQAMLGGKSLKKVALADAEAQAGTFSGTLGEKGKAALSGLGVMGDDGVVDIAKLAEATGEQFRSVLSSGELTDVQERQLITLRELSKATGGTGGTAQALGSLSRRGELAAQFAQGSAMFGGKMLSEMGAVQRMAYEEVVGISGDEFDTRMRLQEKMMAEFEKKGGSEELGVSFEEAVAKGMLGSQEDLEKMSQAQLNLTEQYGRDTLIETTGIGTTMKNIVATLLQRIATSIEWIAGYFGSKSDANGEQISALNTLNRQISKSSEVQGGQETLLASLKEELRNEKDSDKRKGLTEKIEGLAADIAKQEEGRATLSGARERIAEMDTEALERYEGKDLLSTVTQETSDDRSKTRAAEVKKLAEDQHLSQMQALHGSEKGAEVAAMGILPKELTEIEGETLEEAKKQLAAQDAQFKETHAEGIKNTEAVEDVSKTLVSLDRETKLATLLASMNVGDGPETTAEQLSKALETGKLTSGMIKGISQDGVSLEEAAISGQYFKNAPRYAPTPQDFIYQGDGSAGGKITPLLSSDEFYGAKPGGPISQAAGGGGGKSVVININGGSEDRVYRVVSKVLRETGYGNLKSYN
jgi:hypothetical protein